MDKKLLDELAASGVKYNPEDVVMITKAPNGKLLWLEKRNGKAGLKHIVDGHAADFEAKGIKDIPSFLNEVLKAKPIKTGVGKNWINVNKVDSKIANIMWMYEKNSAPFRPV